MVIVFLAQGCEEIEALTQVDFLRRAGLTVQTVGIGGRQITGAHDITITADVSGEEFSLPVCTEAVILPGGMPGTKNLAASRVVRDTLAEASRRGLLIAAICAAPTVLAAQGLLEGKRATCFPGCDREFGPAVDYTGGAVERDGNILTARSVGTAGAFAVAIVGALKGDCAAADLKESLYPNW